MADGRVYRDALTSESTNYKVKVRVVQKGTPQRSARDVLYQSVVVQDDKGNKMRAALFGDQISGHQDVLVCNGVYEVPNAPIKPLLDQYRRDPTEMPYTMGFGRKTLIRPLSTPGAFLPEYQCVSQVPKTATPYDIFDVIGTLLYVEPVAREVTPKQGRKNTVREIIITDHGTDQPIVVSAWNELSGAECEKLASLVTTLPVGFTALRVATYRGFSLTGTMSTVINTKPAGAKVDALIEWGSRNKAFLADLQARVNRVRDPNTPISVVTLSALKNKKAKNTLQDEKYHLRVTVPAPALQKVSAYLGCFHCGKRSDYASGETFKCETCTRDGVVSEPRITFNCEVSDGTENLEITAFTADTLSLFQMSAADIFHLAHTDTTTFGRVCDSLQNEPFTIEVSPKIALSRNHVLQWALRRVVASPSQKVTSVKLPQEAPQDQAIAVSTTKPAVAVARQLDFSEVLQDPTELTQVDIAVSSEYPALRKLPATITSAPEIKQLPGVITDTAADVAQSAISATTPLAITPGPNAIPSEMAAVPNTPVIKAPKVEKAPVSTPVTPTQHTPKRTNAKQSAASPSKKKKAATSSATSK